MKERPILMSAPMVLAILEGRKTQTRRIVRPRVVPVVDECFRVNGKWCNHTFGYDLVELSPHGKPGDRLWVKEKWATDFVWDGFKPTDVPEGQPLLYCADEHATAIIAFEWGAWRPSLFMRRWMSRITLEITDVRAERLQNISEEDAKAEGCSPIDVAGIAIKNREILDLPLMENANPYRNGYALLWESINGPDSWDANPWVWAITVKRITP